MGSWILGEVVITGLCHSPVTSSILVESEWWYRLSVRISGFHPEEHGFNSLYHYHTKVAQSVEHGTENPSVDGSIPSLGTMGV